jgi:hypothetical protein
MMIVVILILAKCLEEEVTVLHGLLTVISLLFPNSGKISKRKEEKIFV